MTVQSERWGLVLFLPQGGAGSGPALFIAHLVISMRANSRPHRRRGDETVVVPEPVAGMAVGRAALDDTFAAQGCPPLVLDVHKVSLIASRARSITVMRY
jgi:hypothetical protein